MTGERGATMQESVTRIARASGVAHLDVVLIGRAHALAMDARSAVLADEEHPEYLHPGRTVLILLRDAELTDGPLLAVAALIESRRPELAVGAARIAEEMPAEVASLHAAVPVRGDPGLAEALVTASAGVRAVSLAEHLDHLRHLHMLPPSDDREALFDEVVGVWGPVAERTHPVLARRYAMWVRTFGRRLARGGR